MVFPRWAEHLRVSGLPGPFENGGANFLTIVFEKSGLGQQAGAAAKHRSSAGDQAKKDLPDPSSDPAPTGSGAEPLDRADLRWPQRIHAPVGAAEAAEEGRPVSKVDLRFGWRRGGEPRAGGVPGTAVFSRRYGRTPGRRGGGGS